MSAVKLAYKRLETDTEFVERVRKTFKWWCPWQTGESLDNVTWESLKMQRKIVVVYP